jgi:hypothetical protein
MSRDCCKEGDTVITLHAWGMGWPYFIQFKITDVVKGGYMGVHQTHGSLHFPDPSGDKEFTEYIPDTNILPTWLTYALIHAWNSFYSNNQSEYAGVICSVGHFVRCHAENQSFNNSRSFCSPDEEPSAE